MNCPRCLDVELLEKDRDGITVDGCPRCRGIWLDRGELERLVASVAKHHDDDDRREDKHDRDRDRDRDRPKAQAPSAQAQSGLAGLGRDRESQKSSHERDRDHDRDRDRDKDRDHRHDSQRYPGDRKRKPRTWLESLTDLFD
jgi:Zn-finger nucleic acid-binding protein